MPLGSGPLGSAQLGGLFDAVAIDAITIDVSTVPLDPAFLLDPSRWSVVPVGLGEVQVVTGVSEQAPGILWRLTLDPGLTLGELEYVVNFDPTGSGLPISASCLSVSFSSPAAAPVFPVPLSQVQEQPYDIANPYLVRDAGIIDPPPLGQMQINDRGDFAVDSRLQGLRKRIMRRISTLRGGFALLPGYGFALSSKENVTPSELTRLAADAKEQVEREPEVVRAQVFVRQLVRAPNIVVVAVSARTTLGLDVAAAQQVDLRPQGVR
jgi:hypothetical protein